MIEPVTTPPPGTAGEPSADDLDSVLTTARALTRDLGAVLSRNTDMTVDQWRVLRRLRDDDGIGMSDLVDDSLVSPATLTRVVDSLVDRGWAYRIPGDDDRRRILVVRSPEGTRACRQADALIASTPRLNLATWTARPPA